MFAVTDQYSRKVFNDLYFKPNKREKEDRLRYQADDLFISVLKPAVFPGAYDCERSRSLGRPGVGLARTFQKPLMEHLGIERRSEPSGICKWGSHRLILPGDGSRYKGTGSGIRGA